MEKRMSDIQKDEARGVQGANGNRPADPDRKSQWIWMAESPAVMHRTDSTGALVEVNKRWCEVTGRSAAEAMGAGWKTMIHPDDREALVEAWERYVSEANRGLRKDGFCFEYRLLNKDGTSVRVCARCAEERSEDGILHGFCGASVEVPAGSATSTTTLPPHTAVEDEWLNSIMNFAPVGMYRLDLSGACVWVCEKWLKMTGWALKDVIGDGWKRVIHSDDLIRTTKEWENSLKSSTPFVSEYRYVKPDRTVIWVYSRIAEQRDDCGVLTGYVGVAVDISQLRQKDGSIKMSARGQRNIKALSKRENDVVRLLRAGLPNKQIASCLGLSVRTVEAHRLRIMRKLGFRSLAELLQYAMQRDTHAE
jgi:PAS domain S-box-containing protein